MNIDDHNDRRPTSPFGIGLSSNGLNYAARHPIHFMFGFKVGGSNGAISGWIKSKMAAAGHFEKKSNGQISAMRHSIHFMYVTHTVLIFCPRTV